ncbi:MAG TPA: glycoside hydrolase family 3 C-terminal domain-containing protein [Chitinispirillaceae bacterium]|nr:glycoside hydrolase family 3 C-terminal domain-containing protein [Chitinispirillaceae bacterium]
MKNKILVIASLIGSLFAVSNADLTAVTVPVDMLHAPGAGLGYLGKVTYTLTVDTTDLGLYQYDSIYVNLEIVPDGGGTALALDAVEGAVGVVHILPKQPQRDIFFRYKGTASGKYKAVVKVTAIETEVMKKTKSIVSEATVSQMVPMFSGVAADKTTTGSDGSFFEQPGLTTASGSLKNIRTADGPHGVNIRSEPWDATCFLTCGGIASTWDVDAAYEQAVAMAEEFRADGRNVCLGPAINIVWNPQGGRAFEYYSEDSYLSGKMAAAAVKGLRKNGVIAAIKHFAVNNKETDRERLNAVIDERSLQELFLPHYKECIVNGGALGVMTAYNKVNSKYCSDSKYLVQDILRNTWGFTGFSMSDWNALVSDETLGDAVKYGADQLLPDRRYNESHFTNIKDARNKAKHIVYANGKVGLLDPSYNHVAFKDKFMGQDHRNLVRRLGAKALVLAKNTGNVLPLPKSGKKIYITGPTYEPGDRESQYGNKAEHQVARLGGGDSKTWESSLVKVSADRRISPEQGIKEYLSALNVSGKDEIVTNIGLADYIIIACGAHGEGESMDRDDMKVYKDDFVQSVMTNASKKPTAKVIVLYTGGSASIPGAWSNADAILVCFGPGQEQGYSIADVLFGDVCPGGKLNQTFPKTLSQLPTFESSGGSVQYNKAEIAHGYFKVDQMGEEPLFAFGHGLSYTTFAYSNLQVYPSKIRKGDRVYVSVDVKNTGSIKGDEVVQLYLSLPTGSVPVRKQDLRGFDRVTLDPGQSETVRFTLEPDDMAYFKVGSQEFDGTGKWDILAGTYKVRAGTSSKIVPEPAQPSIGSSFIVE